MPFAVGSRKQRTPAASTTGVHYFVRPRAEKKSLPQFYACGDDTGTSTFHLPPWNATPAHFSTFSRARLHGSQGLFGLVFKFRAVVELEIGSQRADERILRFAIFSKDQQARACRRTVPADLLKLPLE